MRFRAMLVLAAAILLPALSQSEVLYLKDGSTLQGRVVRLSNDTLYVKTSFGANVPMHRSVLLRIDFDSLGVPTGLSRPPQAPAPGLVVGTTAADAPAGTLMVHIDGVKLSSEVVVERKRNEDEIVRANWIESLVLVDGRKAHSDVDSVMDKVIRSGPETTYRNNMEPRGYKVALPAGRYHCEFRIGNTRAEPYRESFPNGVLDVRLLKDNVTIESQRVTQIRIGMKKKFKGLGSPFLYEIVTSDAQ